MMGQLSTAQAVLRFSLEVAALIAWGMAGWGVAASTASTASGTLLRWVAAVGLVVVMAALWATFRVPGVASASGGAPVAVDGPLRLALELGVLLGAAGAVAAAGYPRFGAVLAGLIGVHYLRTWSRVRWLPEK